MAVPGLQFLNHLQANAAEVRKNQKSCILLWMRGDPPTIDIWDLKPESKNGGEFKPIKTRGNMEISEHMPHCARIMDKLVPIRTMTGSVTGDHDSHICYTGRSAKGVVAPPGGWPSIGSVMTKLCAATGKEVPPFIGLAPNAHHPPYGSPGLPGFGVCR